MAFERITTDPEVLGGVPCIRSVVVQGLREAGHDAVHVGQVLRLDAPGGSAHLLAQAAPEP